jgi:hypothetical protein
MEADTFGARLREQVGAPEEPAGQRQLFPSAAGASAERRIGPRRSFSISPYVATIARQVARYFACDRRAWNCRPGWPFAHDASWPVQNACGSQAPVARVLALLPNAMTWPRARRADGKRFSHGIRHLGVVAASGEKMLLDMIAIVILAGMMLIPVVNIFAGVIIGAGLGGAAGACAGLLLALIVMAGERVLVAWLAAETREPGPPHSAVATAAAHVPARQAAAAVLAKVQPNEFVPAAPLFGDELIEAPLFVGAMARAHGRTAMLSA